MTLEQIRKKFSDCRIEVCENNKVFVHSGGAYPLIFKNVTGIRLEDIEQ